jgi:uncharacterized membrane protein
MSRSSIRYSSRLSLGLPLSAFCWRLPGLSRWPESDAIYLITGALLYLAGTILVTMVCNVPLNNKLARVRPESAKGASLWKQYLAAWTAWNHVRTVAALAGAACFTMALVRWPS